MKPNFFIEKTFDTEFTVFVEYIDKNGYENTSVMGQYKSIERAEEEKEKLENSADGIEELVESRYK